MDSILKQLTLQSETLFLILCYTLFVSTVIKTHLDFNTLVYRNCTTHMLTGISTNTKPSQTLSSLFQYLLSQSSHSKFTKPPSPASQVSSIAASTPSLTLCRTLCVPPLGSNSKDATSSTRRKTPAITTKTKMLCFTKLVAKKRRRLMSFWGQKIRLLQKRKVEWWIAEMGFSQPGTNRWS
ncbi:putative DUF26 domain-containing protein 2 precursor [Tripterygium wilfordii]|uniref:Putative DUF26 domain-containing protein 2 n=1 Tax=Tripterygium wilfordii TaxID=458696 RepID=A0A7J7BV96_TRIWF|nr:putative DUF26 domain-containing protein 2 precursor [Tripterygium wilfordii]